MRFHRLGDWLDWQETLHPRAVDPGLERVSEMVRRLSLAGSLPPLVTVAGTNGKGTTVAALEALLLASGRRPGCYTSPHLLCYNERIRLDGRPADDDAIMKAFDAIDRARDGMTLSYFEFGTLAALWCLRESQCDVGVLEVGLGGRLDAVNAVDPDVAVITRVDLDHADRLGHDREAVGREKAGILRPGKAAVCSDGAPPRSVLAAADLLGTTLVRVGVDYHVTVAADGRWSWEGFGARYADLPRPVGGDTARTNIAGALAALALLDGCCPPPGAAAEAVAAGLAVPGRLSRLPGRRAWLVDVAHNPAAAAALAAELAVTRPEGRRHAVFAAMRRKDVAGILAPLLALVDEWHLLSLPDADACPIGDIAALITDGGGRVATRAAAPELFAALDQRLQAGDEVVALGSFRVAEETLRWHESDRSEPRAAG